eukprot:TRINITY_DN118_c1_g1_i1.p1 TRINITY_DN118_c1_g1~~TRINITY_DN118_c1_g1_i1.p1  ORF type:complete len:499 (+),score=105.87 TRINITY_DN118_c1_g1_i1:74-1570(+)
MRLPAAALCALLPHAAAAAAPRCSGGRCRNVLYILSDDMRADLGAYGLPVRTPALDSLAKEGLLFRHAYCQISVCAPSRMSFMTGMRPDTNRVWNFIDTVPKSTQATPGYFRDHGYLTLGLGKTFHQEQGTWNKAAYWSNDTGFPYYPYSSNTCPHGNAGGGHCVKPDDQMYDWSLRNESLVYLHHAAGVYKSTGQPFFVMTGFRDPHAPWAAPQRMYDLYNESAIAVAQHDTLGQGTPLIAWSNCLAVKLENGTSFKFGPYSAVPQWVQRDQRHAYYAAVSYVDEHVGDLLGVLRDEGVYDDTIIVFHADHGYLLGEHGYWEKKSNFDLTVRVPLIMRVPGRAPGVTDSFTDLVDVFPTLATLAGLPQPQGVDGDDVSALYDTPGEMLKRAAYHQYPACKTDSINQTRSECNNVARGSFDFMGYSVRTPDWRYTVWLRWNGTLLRADWDGERGEELYDHRGDISTDMNKWENVNLASQQPETATQLRAQLRSFFDRS